MVHFMSALYTQVGETSYFGSIEVTQRCAAVGFAEQMRWLVDEAYPEAGTIRVVLDNLNIHKLGSLYEACEPSEARRIARRLRSYPWVSSVSGL